MALKTFVDIFSGCGGFSLGASLAGYKNILSVDIDPVLTSSYKLNFPNSNLQLADLGILDNIRSLIVDNVERPDLLIGGPPCQGFSYMGKRDPDDPRNKLVYHFFRHTKKIRPHFFILENVVGLTNGYGSKVIDAGKELLPSYYKVTDPIIVNANHLGAATTRPRVVIIGYDQRYNQISQLDSLIKAGPTKVTVRDAISDLPCPHIHRLDTGFDWGKYKDVPNISGYAKQLRILPPKGLGWDHSIRQLKHGLLSGLSSTEHTLEVINRFKNTRQGENESISRYFRLKWSEPSRTIRAGTGKDKGNFQAARPIHPSQARVITVREAARLQGFPDWFVFHPSKWQSFRMIGNSVSPIMAKEVISRIVC